MNLSFQSKMNASCVSAHNLEGEVSFVSRVRSCGLRCIPVEQCLLCKQLKHYDVHSERCCASGYFGVDKGLPQQQCRRSRSSITAATRINRSSYDVVEPCWCSRSGADRKYEWR
jgi:hypothetical protein